MASAPLALPREAAAEAGSCVSSALRFPAGSHSLRRPFLLPRDNTDAAPRSLRCTRAWRQRSSPHNDIRSKEKTTCLYSNQDALGFQGITSSCWLNQASAAGFTPSVQVDDMAVTRSGCNLKKTSTGFSSVSTRAASHFYHWHCKKHCSIS